MLLPRERAELLRVMFGDSKVPDSWNQSFHFHDHGQNITYFTLHQDVGGACGTYAVIQVSIEGYVDLVK